MNTQPTRFARQALWAVAVVALLSSCSDTSVVVGPPVVDAGADVDAGDTDIEQPPAAKVSFSVEIAGGNALVDPVTHVDLTLDKDKNTGVKAFQVNVVIATENVPDGTIVQVKVDGGQTTEAKVTSNAARVDNVVLPCAPKQSNITVSAQLTGATVAPAIKTFTLHCDDQCVVELGAITACLTADQDPGTVGFQQPVKVTSKSKGCDTVWLKVTDIDGATTDYKDKPTSLGQATEATLQATLATKDSGIANKQATVIAFASDSQHADRPVGQSDPLVVKITTDKPTVGNLLPAAGTLSLANDDDKNPANGIDIVLTGTVDTLTPGDADAIVIEADGKSFKTKIDVTGKFSQALSFTKSGKQTVKVTATNSCGLVDSAEVVYDVFVEAASLAISKPAAKAILLAKDDGDKATATIYETDFEVTLTSGTDGSTISIFCRKNEAAAVFGTKAVGSAKYSAGAATLTIAVVLDTDDTALGHDISCEARDDAPNPAKSTEVAFKVGLPAPCLKLTQPAADIATKAQSIKVTVQASDLEDAKLMATLKTSDKLTFGPTPIGTIGPSGFSGDLSLLVGTPPKQIPDGVYTLTVDATDSYGNLASDSACSAGSAKVTVDTTPPSVKFTEPASLILDPLVHPDASAAKGYQTDVVVEVVDEQPGTEVEVCLAVGSLKITPCQKSGASNKVKFPAVTLTSGENKLVLTATDPVGNVTTTDPMTVTLKDNAVKVEWVQPTQSTSVATDSVTLKVKVSESDGNKPISGATVALYVNKSNQAYGNVTVSEGAGGVYTLAVAGLASGANEVLVGATPKGSNVEGIGQALVITYKTSKPTVTIDAPKDGAIYNGASSECLAGASDCILDVVVSTKDVADGSEAELSITCGKGKPTTAKANVAADKATFKQVTLQNNETCTLSAKVTDEAAQTASSADVKVTVDRSAPVFGALKAPQTTPVLAVSDIDGNPDNGMQTEVALVIGGLPATSKLTLKIFDDDGKLHSEPKSKSFESIKDGATGLVTWGVISLPDGKNIKLSFEATDPLGNSTKKDFVIEVISDQAEVRLTGTVFVEDKACSSSAPCPVGVCAPDKKCALPWNAKATTTHGVAVIGLPAGSNVRICSNASTAKGDACATAGFKVIASDKTGLGNVILNIAAAADGTHTFVAEAEKPASGPGKSTWISSMDTKESSSRYRRILIDRVAPEVSSCLPPDIKDVPAGCLSAASKTPSGAFAFAVTTKEAGEVATIYDTAGNTAKGTTAANKTAGVAIKLPEGSATVNAQATDLVGNVSAEKLCGKLDVNTIKPEGKFTSPAQTPLLAADKDKLDVVVSSPNSDVEGQAVTLKDGNKTIGSVAFKSGVVTFAHSLYKALADGEHTLTATLKDSCANTNIIGTTPAQITVDTLPPTVTIDAPTQAQVLGDAQDSDAKTGGYQVDVTFGCGGATSWQLELGTDCDDKFANCPSFTKIASDTVSNGGGSEPVQSVTIPFGKTTNYVARVTCTDANGNKTPMERGFQVKLSGCLVSLTGLPADGVVNTSKCASPGKDCAGVELEAKVQYVGPCGSVSAVKLFKDDKESQSATPSNSTATFTVALKDGDKFKLEAKVLAGADAKGSSGPVALLVDLAHPKVAFVKATVLGVTTPASGDSVTYALADDQDAQKNKHQLHASLKVDDASLKGGKLTQLAYDPGDGKAVDLGATGVTTPFEFSGDVSEIIEVKFATVPENATAQIIAKVSDAAGNEASTSFTVTADWIAPAKISINALTDKDLNPRRPYAVLNFNAVADNGSSGKAATSYEVRYSRKAIDSENAFEAACDVKKLPDTKFNTPADPGKADAFIVEGPDGRGSSDLCQFAPAIDNGATKFHFAIRAVDAAGNKGPISDAVSTDKLRLNFAKFSGTGSFADKFIWGFPKAVGDLNGDGKADAAYGGRTGQLCIVYGSADSSGKVADMVMSQATGANHQCITKAKSFGYLVSGPVDVNGDGIDDLVASYGQKVSGDATASLREVHIHLGEKDKQLNTTAAVVVTGITAAASRAIRALGVAGNFNGDKSGSGVAIGDIAFTVDKTVANPYERVMVLPGNSAWSASSPKTIDIEKSADRAANNMAVIRRVDSVGSPIFGITLAAAGNILPDGDGGGTQYDDLLIGQYATSTHVIVLMGRELKGDVELTLSSKNTGTGSADATTVRLYPEDTGIKNFTSAVQVELDGDGVPDLAIQHASTNETTWLYWIYGKKLSSQLGKVVALKGGAITGTTDTLVTSVGYKTKAWFLNIFSAGNFGGLSGGNSHTLFGQRPKWAPDGGQTWLPIRHALKRGGVVKTGASYEFLDFKIGDPITPGSTGFTTYRLASVGDFNGDGFPDILVATKTSYAVLVY